MNAQRDVENCRPKRSTRAVRRRIALSLCLLLPAAVFVVATPSHAAAGTCSSAMKISDRGNATDAWLYITNNTDESVKLTVEKSWDYKGERRTKTATLTLAPKESREVFSFPHKQRPRLKVLSCSEA
jgi:P pilus assembly chaperone PapD